MASTPLYKPLKSNGTSFYAFPSAAEDISAAYQNSNYKMYFSKFVLVNFPKQNTNPGTQSNPIRFNFDTAFTKSANAVPTTNFNDGVIESLRNYVANHETVMRESRLNDNQYFYDTNALSTPAEKIFFKWCKKLNIIDFEAALPQDEYIDTLSVFSSNSINDDSYFQEYLWKEREVINWDTVSFYITSEVGFNNLLEVEFNGDTNFRVGDTVAIYNVTNPLIATGTLAGVDTMLGSQFIVRKIIPSDGVLGQRVIFNVDVSGHLSTTGLTEPDGQAELVYNRLVQYVGEITGVSNVQEANRSYTEVYAHIPDHCGMTPDILFRTTYDVNYRPNLYFPVLTSQIQPEIMGAENFSSPIVSSPQNYPGSYFGQFDTLDFTYETSSGDTLRRSGEYFGVMGDTNNTMVDTSKIDGLGIDFNTDHYVKMNGNGNLITTFDQFNALEINNLPPDDFEFNGILWYYTTEDNNGNTSTNLYGVSFLDNPNNNVMQDEVGLRFPAYTKLVSNNSQDGTSYGFNLSLNFNVSNDNPQDTYNPQAINSLFSMDMFNDAMKKLTSTNDSFLGILAEHNALKMEVQDIKGLVYTQTDLDTIKSRIDNLDTLLRLYSQMQIVSSDTISATRVPGSPPQIRLSNIDPGYSKVELVNTTDMYNAQGVIPFSVVVPENKNFMVSVMNNDETPISMPNNDKLTINLSRDLYPKQTAEFVIRSTPSSSENKKLDIFITTSNGAGLVVPILLVGNIDLPISYNTELNQTNSSSKWKDFNFDIDFNQDIVLKDGPELELTMDSNPYIFNNSVNVGDALYMNNFYLGTASIRDFSGQYKVLSKKGATSSTMTLDLSDNPAMVDYSTSITNELPKKIHTATFSMLSNTPYFTLNKGVRIVVTMMDPQASTLSEKYRVEIVNL